MREISALLYGLGAAQALLLTGVLVRRRQYPLLWLALLTGAFAVDLMLAAAHVVGLVARWPHLLGVDFPVTLLYGPALYLYVRAMLTGRSARRSDGLHLVPFMLLVLGLLPFYLQSAEAKVQLLSRPDGFWSRMLRVLTALKLAHASGYLLSTLYLLVRYRQRLQQLWLTVHRRWLRVLLLGGLALAGFGIGGYLLTAASLAPVGLDAGSIFDDLTLWALALFVCALSYAGLSLSPAFVPPAHPEKPRYARSGLDPEAIARIREQVLALMETEKLYSQPDLTLQALAERLGISPHNLSEVLNTVFGQSFYDFVNGYRVREVQALLADPNRAHLTILALAMEAGFSSKSTFNAAFKKHTGLTPSAYRRRVLARKA